MEVAILVTVNPLRVRVWVALVMVLSPEGSTVAGLLSESPALNDSFSHQMLTK